MNVNVNVNVNVNENDKVQTIETNAMGDICGMAEYVGMNPGFLLRELERVPALTAVDKD